MNTRFLDVSALALILTLSSMTFANAQVASTSPDAVKAGTYKVEPYHTQIGFMISHFGFTNYSGFFSSASGSLVLDPANVGISKLDVSVPVSSVLTTVPVLSTELKNAQWFDAAKYPVATFVSTSVTKTGADTATIEGNLTLHGVTQPVTLQAHLVGSGINPLDNAFTAGFEATGEIKRSAFGIKQYLPLLGDNVTVTIAGAFELAK